MSLTRAKQQTHSLSFPLRISETRRAVTEDKTYDNYVAGLIRQVLLTAPGERVNRPDFGVGLRRMVFAASGGDTDSFVKTLILEGLTKWLKDFIQVEAIEVRREDITLFVQINYVLLQRGYRRYLNLEVTL